MKRIIFASICVMALVLTSCTTYQYSSRNAAIDRRDIQATPTVVDVRADFSKRVEVTSNWQRTKEDAIAECQYLAITENKVDIVVDPIYKIQYRASRALKKFKASLVGFGGYYTNSRTQREDIDALKNLTREDIEKYLILHNPEVLKYMNAQGEVVNINHYECPKKVEKAAEPAPMPDPAPLSAPKKKK